MVISCSLDAIAHAAAFFLLLVVVVVAAAEVVVWGKDSLKLLKEVLVGEGL